MKKKIGISLFLVICIGLGFYYFKNKKEKIPIQDVINQLNDYHLECNMEMIQNDELKTYKIDVDYLKQETDFFRVQLYDKTLNQSQTIIKNQDGVYVYTPSLNQMYKFQSDWPFNSDKPYIYQTLLGYFEQNEQIIKNKEGYQLSGPVTYVHDTSITNQEITLDKNYYPQKIVLYDDDHIEKIKVEVTSFQINCGSDESLYDITKISKDASTVSKEDTFPMLPLEIFGSALAKQEACLIGGVETYILQFTGDKNFTLVQSLPKATQDIQVTETSANLIDLVGSVAFYENQELKSFYPGMTCSIYSNDLTSQEMIEVVSSLQNEVLK